MPRRLFPALAATLAAALTASCDGSTGPSSFEPGALGAVTVLRGEAVKNPQVAGVIGTSCSAGAVAASPVIGPAGFAMVAPNTTSPLPTSNLAGNPSPAYHHGYYRVANNDLHQARALSGFADNERLPVVYRFTP